MELSMVLSEIVALYLLIGGVALLVNSKSLIEYGDEILRGSAATYLMGPIALIFGLVIVLTHNVWTGGFIPVVTTLVGWGALLKGVMIFVLPAQTLTSFMRPLNNAAVYRLFGVLSLLVGAYMSMQLF